MSHLITIVREPIVFFLSVSSESIVNTDYRIRKGLIVERDWESISERRDSSKRLIKESNRTCQIL